MTEESWNILKRIENKSNEEVKTILNELSIEELGYYARGMYYYAENVIKGRWVEAEPVIARHPWRAYEYARDIIKGRFFEAEPIITQDAHWSYWYATLVVKGRFFDGEPAIAQNTWWTCHYADNFNLDFVDGKFVEKETQYD